MIRYFASFFQIDGSTGKKITFKEIHEKSVKMANFLQRHGITVGDRICIVAENRMDWVIPLYATIYLGAIVTAYNPAYTECKHGIIIS